MSNSSLAHEPLPEPETPPTAPAISVGQVLTLRQDFADVFHDPNSRMLDKLCASKMLQLLDELIEWRRNATATSTPEGQQQ